MKDDGVSSWSQPIVQATSLPTMNPITSEPGRERWAVVTIFHCQRKPPVLPRRSHKNNGLSAIIKGSCHFKNGPIILCYVIVFPKWYILMEIVNRSDHGIVIHNHCFEQSNCQKRNTKSEHSHNLTIFYFSASHRIPKKLLQLCSWDLLAPCQ